MKYVLCSVWFFFILLLVMFSFGLMVMVGMFRCVNVKWFVW